MGNLKFDIIPASCLCHGSCKYADEDHVIRLKAPEKKPSPLVVISVSNYLQAQERTLMLNTSRYFRMCPFSCVCKCL